MDTVNLTTLNELSGLGMQFDNLTSLVEAAEAIRVIVCRDWQGGAVRFVTGELSELDPLVREASRAMARVTEFLSGKLKTAEG